MTVQHIPPVQFGWLNIIGQIGATNPLCFHRDRNGLAVALEPVDQEGETYGTA